MVKNNKTKVKVKKIVMVNPRAPRQRKGKRGVTRLGRNTLDVAAFNYARLLADPCNGNLCRGISMGSSGSLVVRLETDVIFFAEATTTAGVAIWYPGSLAGFTFSAALDSTLTNPSFNSFIVPGSTYLSASASSIRCIAGCAQVMFPGTEFNRSGVLGLGVVPCSAVSKILPVANGGTGAVTTAAAVRQMCQFTERMPDTMAEIIWRPGQADGEMTDLANLNAFPTHVVDTAYGKNAIIISASGFPVSTGVRLRYVGIYEYEPVLAAGFVATVETNPSGNSVNDVLRSLDREDDRWFINGFKKAGKRLVAAGVDSVTEQLISLMNPGGNVPREINY
jgi:hypothetical protein